MTVKELRKVLKQNNKEAEVLIVDKHGLIYEIDAIMFGGPTEKRITPTNCERVLLAHIGEHIDAVGWFI